MAIRKLKTPPKPPSQPLPFEGWRAPAGGAPYRPTGDPHDPYDVRASEAAVSGATALGMMVDGEINRLERVLRARQDNRASVRLQPTAAWPERADATPLQRYREAAGFTRGRLAKISGVDIAEVESIEDGGQLRKTAADKLAAALAIDPEALTDE